MFLCVQVVRARDILHYICIAVVVEFGFVEKFVEESSQDVLYLQLVDAAFHTLPQSFLQNDSSRRGKTNK